MTGEKKKGIRFSSEEIAGFCNQIAIILKGGISLYEGVYILSEEVEEKATKQILEQMDSALKDNKTFYQALEQTKAFPNYMLYMVKVGERTGKLETVMEALAAYYERESNMKAGIRNVVTYPLMMFAMMVIILFVLVIKILPMFEHVFHQLTVDVADSSSRIMSFGLLMGKIVAIISAVILLLVIALRIWYQTKAGKKGMDAFAARFILTRKAAKLMATGKFMSAMSLMLSSGLDTKEALEMASQVVEHKEVNKKITGCISLIEDKASLEEAMKTEKLVSGMQGRMVSVASKTGVLDEVLGNISQQYDETIDQYLSSMCARIETSLVVALSLVVGAVLISIMFPLVSIISSIG